MILRWTMLFCLVFGSVSFAQSTDAAKQAKVEELFKVMKLDQISTQMMKQAMDITQSTVSRQMSDTNLSAKQQQDLDIFTAKVKKYVSDTLSWEKLEPQYAKIYEDVFTEQEIDGMLGFYKSPTGQAVIEKTPIAMKESVAMARQNMAIMLPVVQQMTKDFISQESSTTSPDKAKTAK